MAGNIPAICLEGYTPVPSGLHLGIDPTAEVPTRVLETPELPGIVQVHLGEGSLGATRIGDALAREHVGTLARMVQTLAPDVTRSVTRAGVDAWTGVGLPVRLPGRTDLLDPADQYVLPVDAAGRTTDPLLATGVVVLPKQHLADTLTTAVRTGVGPVHPAMSGQLRFDGDVAWIGLPAAMVNPRHADLTEVRPTGDTGRVTSLPALLTHLETLRPGERAVVDVTSAAGAPPQAYHVIAAADGLSVLRFSGGTATAAPLPRTFDAMTVTMPGQLGRSAASLATLVAQLPPINLADLAACVTGVRNLARDLYGSVRTGQAADDLATLPGTLTRSPDPSPDPFAAVTDRQWGAFDSLSTVSQALRGAPAGSRGATVFALVGRPGSIGHAVAFRDTADGLRAVDFRAGEVGGVRPADEVASDLVDARMLLVDGNGQVTAVATAVESGSTVRALVDPGLVGPGGVRYAGRQSTKHGRSSGSGGREDKGGGDRNKRRHESDSDGQKAATKRPATVDANVMAQIRAILTRFSLDFGRLPQQGRSTDQVNFRYPRSYKNSPADAVGQSLRHLSLALHDAGQQLRDANKATIASSDRDFEMQAMIINGRLVIASNSDTTTRLLDERARDLPQHPIRTLIHERGRARYKGQERIEAQRRLNAAVDKLDGSADVAHPRPANAVTNILSSDGPTVTVDASDREAVRHALTSPDLQNAIILLRHSPEPNMHAEQKLMIAVDRSGLTSETIWGDFAIHGRMRPCLACLLGLEHLNGTHGVQHNTNPGAAYDAAFESLLRHRPQVATDPYQPQAQGHWVLSRLEEMLAGDFRTNYSAWSNEQAPEGSVQGPAPQYGLQSVGERPHDRRNYETPSTSGDERTFVDFEPTVAGDVRTVRQDLRNDPDALRLRELSEQYAATRKPNTQLPREWTEIVQRLNTRLENARAISEYTPGISEATVLKHAKQAERLLQAPGGDLTPAIEGALWQELRDVIPSEWRNDPTRRKPRNVTPAMTEILAQMKAWGVKAAQAGKSAELGLSGTSATRLWGHLPDVERRTPTTLREDTTAAPVAQEGLRTTLAYRPAPSASEIAAQEQFERQLTDFYEVDGIRWYVSEGGQYYQHVVGTTGRMESRWATSAQAARIRQVLDGQQAESSAMGAARFGGASGSGSAIGNGSGYTRSFPAASVSAGRGPVTTASSGLRMTAQPVTASPYQMSEPSSVRDTTGVADTGYVAGSDTSSEHGGTTTTGPVATQQATQAPAPQYVRGRDYYVGDNWVARGPQVNAWEQTYTRPDRPGRRYRPILGRSNYYQLRESGSNRWQLFKVGKNGNYFVKHLAAPATTLEPLVGEPTTTPLAQGNGVVFGVPGSELVRDLSEVRLPEGGFVVLGEGYRNDAGDTVRGGIRSTGTAYATSGTISAQIPAGTAAADIIACEIVSTGTLRELFRQRPEMTVVGADTEVFVVQAPEGSTAPAKVFTAETVWVDGRPQLVQTGANQFRAYRPGMSPDAEPEALGHYLPGTGVPTREEMARAVEVSRAFHRLPSGVALHLGPSESPVDQIVRTLTTTGLEDPKPGLKRARPLVDDNIVFNRDLRALLERQIDHGEHLAGSLKNLGKLGFVKATLGDRLHVRKHRIELHHAISGLHGALASIPAPRTGATVNPVLDRRAAEERVADIARAIEGYAHVAEEIAKHMRDLVTDAAVKAAVRGEASNTRKALQQVIGMVEGSLGWTASVFVPTGLAAVPAAVGFVGKGAGIIALREFEKYQANEFQKKNSSTKALLLADIQPALMAKSIAASYQRGFELFLAAAGFAGAYVPGWPVISAGLTKIFQGFFEERTKMLEKQIAEMKAAQHGATIPEKEIYRRLGDRLWTELRNELKQKLKNVGTVQQIVTAAKGEPELMGLINIGTDFAVQLGLGVAFVLFPPKPAVKIDGEDLRNVILDVIGNRNPADKIVPSTSTPLVPDEAIPASVPQTDARGRSILAYKASMSKPDAPYVKINVHGTNLWGSLTGTRFTPQEPDAGAFVPRQTWRDRVIGNDHYIETLRDPDTGSVGERTRVDGTWHKPWADKHHYLFVHSEDGTWEWAHAFSPTGRLDSDEFSLRAEFDRNQQWLKPFTFEPPAALAVDFGARKLEPTLNSGALRQFVDNVAWKAADLSRTYGPRVPLKIHVEGGSNGHNALRAGIDKLNGLPEQAVAAGLTRAEAVRAPLVTMLGEALARFRYLHPGQADQLPTAEDLVASASTRGSRLDASQLPDGLLKPAVGLDDDALHRQTRVWFEELTVAAPGSPASAQSSLGSSFHESDLDAKPNWLADAQEKMPHPQNAPANLVSDTGALVAKGAPPRDLLRLAENNPGQVYFWLSTPARQAPTSTQITELNEVLEQFAQGRTQVTVFTKGVVSDELLDAIAPYGGALANSAPAAAGGLSVSLDNPWHVQPADRTVPRSQRPDQPSPKLDDKLAATAAKLHRDPRIPRADEEFGEFVWGGLSVREQYDRLRSAPATYLTQANKALAEGMAQRVKTSMRAGIVDPLLTFGPETDVVPRYHEATIEERPKAVISSVYELADAGVKADVPITEKFQTLVEATGRGATDVSARNQFDFTSALLKAVDLARAGRFTDVGAWVAENKPRLDATMKRTWVDALGDVIKDLGTAGKAGEAQQLERVLGAVYDC
ncbi:hypothetical protein AB0B39_11675 [Micromonospora sp. NPDC049114]|uniref:hypothetical protein n=1 Tax=Micromonospora sp. NPDC049114 TaxID=3155498 RepID=UPI0033FA07CB